MKRPKILIIENSIDVTGALKSITRTAYDLRDQFDFIFIIPKNSKSRFWIEGKGFVDIIELPMREISRRFASILLYVPYLLSNAFRLNRIIKQHNISLIHVNDIYNLLPVVTRLLGNSTPYICHIRFLPNKFPGWLFTFWLKLNLRYSIKVIAVSKSVLSQLPKNSKLILIYNELPVEERYPKMGSDNPEKTNFTFLYLSNFIKGKGQNFALEAFRQIHEKLPNWKLRFVGGDMGLKKNIEFKNKLIALSKSLGIYGKIEWKEFTEDVEREYKAADIVLNFSESESFSITCLEALYFGRPVIATDCGGPSEIIEHEKSGILVPNMNVNEMAKGMLLLAINTQKRNDFAAYGKDDVRVKFSIKETSNKIMKLYQAILYA